MTTEVKINPGQKAVNHLHILMVHVAEKEFGAESVVFKSRDGISNAQNAKRAAGERIKYLEAFDPTEPETFSVGNATRYSDMLRQELSDMVTGNNPNLHQRAVSIVSTLSQILGKQFGTKVNEKGEIEIIP